jgi:hypothetical protein
MSTRNNPSFSNLTLARLVTGALASGVKASRSVEICFCEVNFKRTVAFAPVVIMNPQCLDMFFKVISKTKKIKKN